MKKTPDPTKAESSATSEHDFTVTNNQSNDLNLPTGQRPGSESKAFATLAARFALAGHSLSRSNPSDGAVMYFAWRWGLHRALPDLEAAAQFLAVIGGGNV